MPLVARWMVLMALATPLLAQDKDSDRDGLSDFHEIHKHLTDPKKKDSDGDGTPDGDWRERREYTYTVRSVVHVMKPVTPEYLNDDYQDARVLDETDTWVELEVIHYPFNTVADTIEGNPKWRRDARKMKEWIDPGPTSDWNKAMRTKILQELAKDGIDVKSLDDKEVVERVSKWLMKRATYHDGFSSFVTAFDEKGRPFVPEDLRGGVERGEKEKGITLEQQWRQEISARGMFETKRRGSCTSSAIYISGCLRAVGIPTRTILCIPLVDASDERELEMVRRRLDHNTVRRAVDGALSPITNSWASHTFNEVWVGGRWRRLNYSKLGQNIFDPGLFGLMTHVATFRDWADAEVYKTIGRRQKGSGAGADVFGGRNPYSTISLRDEFGVHCRMENPPEGRDIVRVAAVHWTDSKKLPEHIRKNCEERGRFGLIAHLKELQGSSWLESFLARTDLRVFLDARGHPRLKVGFDPGCWWYENDECWIYVPFGGGDRRDLEKGVTYTVSAQNSKKNAQWDLDLEIRR